MYITQKTLNIIIQIEQNACKLNTLSIPVHDKKSLIKQKDIQNLLRYLKITGFTLTETELKKTLRKMTPLSNNDLEKHIRNFQNANQFITSTDAKEPNLAILQQIHSIITNDILDYWDRGRLRSVHEKPDTSMEYLKRNEPKVYKTSQEIVNLTQLSTDIFPLIRLHLWLNDLIDTYPFSAYNLQTIVMFAKFIPIKQTLPESQTLYLLLPHISIATEYISRIYENNDKNPDARLNTFLNIYLRHSKNILNFLYSKLNIAKTTLQNLNKRQLRILSILKRRKRITRQTCADMLNVSFMTIYRDLKYLERLKLISRKGNGKATYYVLKS